MMLYSTLTRIVGLGISDIGITLQEEARRR